MILRVRYHSRVTCDVGYEIAGAPLENGTTASLRTICAVGHMSLRQATTFCENLLDVNLLRIVGPTGYELSYVHTVKHVKVSPSLPRHAQDFMKQKGSDR